MKADAFLSEILGKPAYHWSGGGFQPPAGPAFVDAKVAVDDISSLLALQDAGFKVLDTNVQLERPAGAIAREHGGARAARPADEATVRRIAAEAFIYDRFHRDPAIGHGAASRLKTEWAGNYFAGNRGDRMIVAEDKQGICGFLQLLESGPQTVIDLIAVDSRCRGGGMAQAMIALAADAADARTMKVGTQLANLPSLALYRKLGFVITAAFYVLHLHTGEQT